MKNLLILIVCGFAGASYAQIKTTHHIDFSKFEFKVKKTGPYFGYARGKYDVFELGVERIYKKIKLKKPPIHAIHLGFNYNIGQNVLGYEAGYWYKSGRVGLTYGSDLVLRTNFKNTRLGGGPCLGYRLLGFHLQTGYHWLSQSSEFDNTNTFFIRLRFTLIQERDRKIKTKK